MQCFTSHLSLTTTSEDFDKKTINWGNSMYTKSLLRFTLSYQEAVTIKRQEIFERFLFLFYSIDAVDGEIYGGGF